MKLGLGIAALLVWMLTAAAWAAEGAAPSGASGSTDANVERFLMEGTEIQGTLEKPHVVYVVPWKDISSAEGDIPLHRSFRQELFEPVDRARFQRHLSRGSANATGGGFR